MYVMHVEAMERRVFASILGGAPTALDDARVGFDEWLEAAPAPLSETEIQLRRLGVL